VVGFDDIHLSEFTIPPLTTVQMSQHNLAMIAFHALLDEVESQNSFREPRKYELITNLVLRQSTALAPLRKAAVAAQDMRRTARPKPAPVPASR
jgi:LacI family transcriptional regulator